MRQSRNGIHRSRLAPLQVISLMISSSTVASSDRGCRKVATRNAPTREECWLGPKRALVQKMFFGQPQSSCCFGSSLFSQAPAQKSATMPSIANFSDIAEKAGLTAVNIFGGGETKKYIIETTRTGVGHL